MHADQIKEIVDRTRRIETRLTRFMSEQGFDTQTRKPIWQNGSIRVPTMAISIHDLVAVIPDGWPGTEPITVYHQGDFVMDVYPQQG